MTDNRNQITMLNTPAEKECQKLTMYLLRRRDDLPWKRIDMTSNFEAQFEHGHIEVGHVQGKAYVFIRPRSNRQAYIEFHADQGQSEKNYCNMMLRVARYQAGEGKEYLGMFMAEILEKFGEVE